MKQIELKAGEARLSVRLGSGGKVLFQIVLTDDGEQYALSVFKAQDEPAFSWDCLDTIEGIKGTPALVVEIKEG